MPDSEWIVFLPMVGAILGAVVGAFGGAYANSRYRDREAKKAEDRELKGLMTLIAVEYGHNDGLLKILVREPSLIDVHSFTYLQTAVWDDSKVRLAQLLPTNHVSALVLYYGQIQTILDDINDDEMPPEIKRGIVQDDAKRAQKYGKAAMGYAAQYMFVDHPEYTEDVHRAFVREAKE